MKLLTREDILQIYENSWETRLRQFCEAVEKGEAPNPALMADLAIRFRRILEGAKPAKALGIKNQRGRPPNTRKKSYFSIAEDMVLLMRPFGPLTYLDAVEAVCQKHKAAPNTIKKAYALHHRDVRFMLQLERRLYLQWSPLYSLSRMKKGIWQSYASWLKNKADPK